jgi:putative transposase
MQKLLELPEAAREQALARFHLLQPHLEEKRPLDAVAKAAGLNFRTAGRWVARYREYGIAGLARQKRADQGARRVLSSEMRRLIEGLALERPRLHRRSIYRQVQQFAAAMHEPAPSYWSVRMVVQELSPGLLSLAHKGAKAYGEAFDLVHLREASRPNAMWQADHAQLDILLVREDGSTAKPWLTIILDDYSRAVAGYYLAFEPPSVSRTALALRQGIWRKGEANWPVCGIPAVLYTDNGTDFTSLHMKQVAVDLKIQLTFTTPGHPRGRGKIERFFRTVNDMFLCNLEGYLKRSRRKPTLTLEDLEQKFRAFLLDVYHRKTSPETPGAPVERWETNGFLPQMPDSLEQLDLLLMHSVRSRKVRRDGIHFERLRYLSPTLAAYVGEEITVRFDPRDMGEVRVFYRDKFLCRAISADLAGESVTLGEIVRARNIRRQELSKTLRDRRQAVDSLLELRRGQVEKPAHGKQPIAARPQQPRLKRYWNEDPAE